MQLISLHNREGLVVAESMIDDEDFELVGSRSWCMSNGYAVTGIQHPAGGRISSGKIRRTLVRMHRLILGLTDPVVQVDHRNRNPLDNQRHNLRISTNALNRQNLSSYRGSSSQFRGVSWDTRLESWRAYAKLNGRLYHLGLFASERQAADIASAWRLEHMPFTEE